MEWVIRVIRVISGGGCGGNMVIKAVVRGGVVRSGLGLELDVIVVPEHVMVLLIVISTHISDAQVL